MTPEIIKSFLKSNVPRNAVDAVFVFALQMASLKETEKRAIANGCSAEQLQEIERLVTSTSFSKVATTVDVFLRDAGLMQDGATLGRLYGAQALAAHQAMIACVEIGVTPGAVQTIKTAVPFMGTYLRQVLGAPPSAQ